MLEIIKSYLVDEGFRDVRIIPDDPYAPYGNTPRSDIITVQLASDVKVYVKLEDGNMTCYIKNCPFSNQIRLELASLPGGVYRSIPLADPDCFDKLRDTLIGIVTISRDYYNPHATAAYDQNQEDQRQRVLRHRSYGRH